MNALGQRIARLIEAQGPLSIAQFMMMALYDPNYGYYATRDPFGASGDFITAPEVSQMFGELLGLWIVQCWQEQGKPSPCRLVELGPGRGTLMRDALRAARLVPEFLSAVEVVLVEASPVLTVAQKTALTDSSVRIRWAAQFDDAFTDLPLFLIANEFFDALPIRQFVRTERGWCERLVGVGKDGALIFALAPESSPLPTPRDAPQGAVREVSPASTALVERIAEAIAQKSGAALIVDYGYGTQSGFGETLQAVGKHGFKTLLESPGEVDLSAHVDFAALAQAARDGGAVAHGPTTQSVFLAKLGIAARAEKLIAENHAAGADVAAALERLTGAEQMGTLFKALAITQSSTPAPPGF